MRKSLKINNVELNNVLLVESGPNIIKTNLFKEEFFGIYSVMLGDKSIICESEFLELWNPEVVRCNVQFNDNIYSNIEFELVKSSVCEVRINKNSFTSSPSTPVVDKKYVGL
jgi:hypothetical protein